MPSTLSEEPLSFREPANCSVGELEVVGDFPL